MPDEDNLGNPITYRVGWGYWSYIFCLLAAIVRVTMHYLTPVPGGGAGCKLRDIHTTYGAAGSLVVAGVGLAATGVELVTTGAGTAATMAVKHAETTVQSASEGAKLVHETAKSAVIGSAAIGAGVAKAGVQTVMGSIHSASRLGSSLLLGSPGIKSAKGADFETEDLDLELTDATPVESGRGSLDGSGPGPSALSGAETIDAPRSEASAGTPL